MSRTGFTVWLTGPPASGKTTLSRLLTRALKALGVPALCLEEAEFSGPDPAGAARQAAGAAAQAVRSGTACVVGLAAPFAALRRELRAELGEYVEVHLDCPLEQRINRDHEGRYAAALAPGGIGLAALEGPYQPPADPEVRCPTGQEGPGESLGRVLAYLSEAGLIEPSQEADPGEVYSDQEEAEVVARLKDLGYL
ncbi:MAG: adenylyl-sulfate kinase [Desulfarculaceae bacterium]|nr:adenylyl-sulfate kinase [Desulfarculaceae bacterium]MCF8072530.1 adenylyl-sulfate kinase [Desulfarculaceae bacterium]MCF8103671.1 adenylyl-sulfate kinase [Desulfarculaceae bacterium]MCF8117071.1 adenylyl-sulfate kinase [Desulfarculaceae bacterium]